MTEYYRRRRFEFYKAGLKTIRLPGAMCGPVFMVTYDIARLCQTPFTPVVRHPDWAAKLNALAMVIFGTPEFLCLRPQTAKRYKGWLRAFLGQIGGRCFPVLRYIETARQYQAHPTRAALRKISHEFRSLLRKAAKLEPQLKDCQPGEAGMATNRIAVTVSKPVVEMRPEIAALMAILRGPARRLSPEEVRKREMRDKMRYFVIEQRRLRMYPRHMQIMLQRTWANR